MKLYNTLTRKVEKVQPLEGKKIKLFVCGPTVYDLAHIGNAKTYIQFDVLARVLRQEGYEVFYLQNITDIDDKIINRAKEQGIGWEELRRKYESEYLKDMDTLNNTAVTKYARATDYINDIIRQVQALMDKGHAYRIDDGIYFEIATFPDYGKLSGRTEVKENDAETRIDQSDQKKGWNDFCLWKFSENLPEVSSSGPKPPDSGQNLSVARQRNNSYASSLQKDFDSKSGNFDQEEIPRIGSEPGEPIWDAPFGKGRPGWHIEDTAITEHHFGPQYDVHGGAVDLIFPHHEAEITQMESASGKVPFVRHWVHTGFLNVNNAKMSKSAGNFYTIRDVLDKGYDPMALRLLMLQTHYRSPINFTWENLDAANNRLQAFRAMADLRFQIKNETPQYRYYDTYHSNILECVSSDLNTPAALATISKIADDTHEMVTKENENEFLALLELIDELFGLNLLRSSDISNEKKQLIHDREKARALKDFARSDELRDELKEQGIEVRDTPYGPIWSRV